MLPVVALVGRPNVGKSTLFNVLTRSRSALVIDAPGMTRDRQYGMCRLADAPFAVVDTGGLAESDDAMSTQVARQAALAMAEADVVVLMVDARAGLLAGDQSICGDLRRAGKPIILAVNKTDGLDETLAVAEFASLGLSSPVAIAAAHGRGTQVLLGLLQPLLPAAPDPSEDADTGSIRVTIVGRPNAGKSTLVNRLTGQERVVVTDQAGTTRDAIDVPLERDGKRYTLVDTAGIRRRGRVDEASEKLSVIKALDAIARSQVVVLMVDARTNLAEQDLTLIGHVVDAGRALVIAVNKWDDMAAYDRERCQAELDRRLTFVGWAQQVFISALHGSGLRALMRAVDHAHACASRVLSAASLTRTLEQAYAANQPAMVHGHTPKLRYAHPGGRNPPTIIIHGSRTTHITAAYRRYLENAFRKRYHLDGTPVHIEFKDGDNPFAGRRNVLTVSQQRKRARMIKHVKRGRH